MHRSRIGALFIDHPTSSFEKSWAAVTGRPLEERADTEHPYRSLGLFDGRLLVEMQHVGEAPHTPDFEQTATAWP